MNLEIPNKICDCHIHVADRFPKILTRFNLKDLEQHMIKYAIDSVLISAGFDKMRTHTRHFLKNSENHKDIFVLSRGLKVHEFENALENNGQMVGLKVNPSQGKIRIIESYFAPYLELLNDQQAILLLHCGRWQAMSSWIYGQQVNKRYPDIKLILAHMGGTHVDFAIPCIEGIKRKKNMFLDTSQVRQPIILQYAIEKLGSKRILFGSDIPWGSFLPNLAILLDLDLKETQLNDILRDNFKRVVEK